MDPRLIHYYERELRHLRAMGGEFAEQFPKIAARLSMSDLEVADPYVERLLEGVAFLAARVQLKLDAEFPRFTQALLEVVHPHYLAPTPAMLVAQFTPDAGDPNLASGFKRVPRGSAMQGPASADTGTACEFRTAQDVVLWPCNVTAASYFSYAPDLPLNTLPIAQRIKGGVRLRLAATAGLKFAQTAIDRLRFFLAGDDTVANRLYELCGGSVLGALVVPSKRDSAPHFIAADRVRPTGFQDDEALLPVSLRSFQGYRLLQEYFAFPQRFRFIEIGGLAPAIRRAPVDELEIVVLFGRGDPTLESIVDRSNFALYCTPAINLFEKRADRIQVSGGTFEFPVVVDRTRPLDFEVFAVNEVTGHGSGDTGEQRFLPFYAAYSTDEPEDHAAYFTTRREPRLPSSAQKRRGPRSSYIGTEVFLSLVDAAEAPYRGDLRQLSIKATCTNRDLVMQMPITGLSLDIAAPVTGIRVVAGPTRPAAPLTDGAVSWRAVNHLSLNYLSLVNSTPEQGAAALRDLLMLYAPTADAGARKQVDGIRSVQIQPIVRRLRGPGPLVFGRGLEITITVDEIAFEGGSAYLLGAMLDRYFARHVSINAFTELVLRSETRGEISRWMPQAGARPTL
jgi:type VI secretion system protein ImpG